MRRTSSIIAVALATTTAIVTAAIAQRPDNGPAAGPQVVVYVTSQNLFYSSIVLADLPPFGPFQQLEMGGPSGLMTEFGPGAPGYVGGRWWVDVNGNGEMDNDDDYFLCPLLPPGTPDP